MSRRGRFVGEVGRGDESNTVFFIAKGSIILGSELLNCIRLITFMQKYHPKGFTSVS